MLVSNDTNSHHPDDPQCLHYYPTYTTHTTHSNPRQPTTTTATTPRLGVLSCSVYC